MKRNRKTHAFMMYEVTVAAAIITLVVAGIYQIYYEAGNVFRESSGGIQLRFIAEHEMDLLRLDAASGTPLTDVEMKEITPSLKTAKSMYALKSFLTIETVEGKPTLKRVTVTLRRGKKKVTEFSLHSLIRIKARK